MWCTDVTFQNVWMVRSFSKKRIFFTARAAFKFFFFSIFFPIGDGMAKLTLGDST